MQKRHFEAFARLVRESDADIASRRLAAYLFARIAADDNPRFDAERFYRACGLSEVS